MSMRREHDLLGDRDVPAEAYYGVHTLRAVENFPITATPISIYPDLISALASIKIAAARSNRDLGLLDATRADAIIAAAEEIRAGRLHEQFVVDVIQGGAGTSTNMNANEVIANRALELLGREKGDYKFLHPNEQVNMSQSTNDVYPTALKLAAYSGIMRLVEAMATLRQAFEAKSEEFKDIIKMGRNDHKIRHAGDVQFLVGLAQQLSHPRGMLPLVERRSEGGGVQPGLAGELGEQAGVADIEASLEESAHDGAIVFVAAVVVLGEFESLVRELRVRLRRDFGEPDLHSQPGGQRIHRALPCRLKIVAIRPQRWRWVRPQFERHPFHRRVAAFHCLFQRKLRQKAEGSNVIGIHANRYRHGFI
jgi:hypothetical protein